MYVCSRVCCTTTTEPVVKLCRPIGNHMLTIHDVICYLALQRNS